MSEVLINVESISKKFCRNLKRSLWYGMQDLGLELTGCRRSGDGSLRQDEFWAVRDVSFELKRGECLGLIGRNGAGKTTLLRMLNGLIKPDRGRIELRGKVGALIALGAGFNPILTGRENIYVNASVLGLRKREIDAKLDDIVEFAELEEFIDAPVQGYSSGMQVRLGFAAASVMEPDILLLDEVLAVGDAAFKFKCYRRMDQLLDRTAVIFVSHDMPQVARICDRVLFLNRGEVGYSGPVSKGIEVYQGIVDGGDVLPTKMVRAFPPIADFDVLGLPDEIDFRSPFSCQVKVKSSAFVGPVTLRLDVKNQAGGFAASCVVRSERYGVEIAGGENIWRLSLSSLPLKPGNYVVCVNLADESGALIAVWHSGHKMAVKGGEVGIVPDCQLSVTGWDLVPVGRRQRF